MRGVFLVLEGLDASGKTTIARGLAERLDAHLLTTPSPEIREVRQQVLEGLGGSRVAAQAFYLATVAAASEQARQLIAKGVNVVLDRYLLSTMLYAAQRGEHLRWDELESWLLPADLTVFLDVPLEERRARLAGRGEATAADTETLDPRFDEAVRRSYLSCATHSITGQLVVPSPGDPIEMIESIMQAVVAYGRATERGGRPG